MNLDSFTADAHIESGGTDLALTPHFLDVAVDAITASKTNPRKHFDADAMKELAESMRTHGLAQPILLRPLTVSRMDGSGRNKPSTDRFELVAGERRLRAARTLAWPTIPAIVRPLTDLQALELQVIENLQRADLHPLEEAEGYERLMKKHGFTVDDLVARVGKSKSYVYQRLKLTALSLKARKAFYAGTIDATQAVLVARIPHEKLQDLAVKEIDGQEMSYRQAAEFVQRRFMLRLADAPFKTDDAALYPQAGPCTTCPKRTGNQPELFGDVKSADVCTDPNCFDVKRNAAAKLKIEAARAVGAKVIEGKAAKDILPYEHGGIYGGYARLDHATEWIGDKNVDLAKVAKKVGIAPAIVVSPHNGEPIEVIDRDAVIRAGRAAGEIAPNARASSSRPSEEAERQKKAKIETAARMRLLRATTAAAAGQLTSLDWREIAAWIVLNCLDHDARKRLCALREWDKSWAEYGAGLALLQGHMTMMSDAELALLIFDCHLIGEVYKAPWSDGKAERLFGAAARHGLDAAALVKTAKAELGPKKKAPPAKKTVTKKASAPKAPARKRADREPAKVATTTEAT